MKRCFSHYDLILMRMPNVHSRGDELDLHRSICRMFTIDSSSQSVTHLYTNDELSNLYWVFNRVSRNYSSLLTKRRYVRVITTLTLSTYYIMRSDARYLRNTGWAFSSPLRFPANPELFTAGSRSKQSSNIEYTFSSQIPILSKKEYTS